jgi:hypothetical protein
MKKKNLIYNIYKKILMKKYKKLSSRKKETNGEYICLSCIIQASV